MNSKFKIQGLVILSVASLFTTCTSERKSETSHVPVLTKADSNLLEARRNLLTDSSEENCIWLGRRLSYLNRFDSAIALYTKSITRFPESYKLLRHRGHRYISTRQFDLAIQDLEAAASLMKDQPIETEPDGLPNKINTPLSTGHFNVWYHLGLAYYLKGDLEKATNAYQECMKVSSNDDLKVATADWLYMTYRRLGKTKEAQQVLDQIPAEMTIIENDSYFNRLKMYKKLLPPDSLLNVNSEKENFELSLATQGYGVANWYYVNGEKAKAKEVFDKIVHGKSVNSFGFIAAETDLKRLTF